MLFVYHWSNLGYFHMTPNTIFYLEVPKEIITPNITSNLEVPHLTTGKSNCNLKLIFLFGIFKRNFQVHYHSQKWYCTIKTMFSKYGCKIRLPSQNEIQINRKIKLLVNFATHNPFDFSALFVILEICAIFKNHF